MYWSLNLSGFPKINKNNEVTLELFVKSAINIAIEFFCEVVSPVSLLFPFTGYRKPLNFLTLA